MCSRDESGGEEETSGNDAASQFREVAEQACEDCQ